MTQPALFFHGLPGSPDDIGYMHDAPEMYGVNWLEGIASDPDPVAGLCAQFDTLSRDTHGARASKTPTPTPQPKVLIGFSLGAMAALLIAASRPAQVSRVILIAPAAPWNNGVFGNDMAGGRLFTMAQNAPKALRMVTRMQARWYRLAPRVLTWAASMNNPRRDRRMLHAPQAQQRLDAGLRHALLDHQKAYVSALELYVSDWGGRLKSVTCPVDIHAGLSDTWTPPNLVKSLNPLLAQPPSVTWIKKTGHFGTLMNATLDTPDDHEMPIDA